MGKSVQKKREEVVGISEQKTSAPWSDSPSKLHLGWMGFCCCLGFGGDGGGGGVHT